ncbi:hypothetical protein [Streptomyces natalensis]|uniref:Uncharacterized protein n=1 Tax=Streptomyces natalensis ATCC 27448 TaxID=1240678 RepID=A0A0D7CHH9_9ACTN|nr:hypothetical protein [Streptomyces natalensis]KIZ15310.1 hypothetical protein SNA_27440 [Streptomyces natalensis ATCC 27448]
MAQRDVGPPYQAENDHGTSKKSVELANCAERSGQLLWPVTVQGVQGWIPVAGHPAVAELP